MGDLPGGPVVKISLPVQGVQVRSLVEELRSHMPQGQRNQNMNNRSSIVTISVKPLKTFHIKKRIFKNYDTINRFNPWGPQ